jgi:DNA-binding NtrC family response regulator
MPIVTLYIPGSISKSELKLTQGEVILIGRHPDVATLPRDLRNELTGRQLRLHAIQSPQVSLNHLLVRSDLLGVAVLDLQSRNGSWVRTPSTRWTHLASNSDAAAEIALTSAWFSQRSQSAIPKATWHTAVEYSESVVTCIQQWLHQQGVDAEVKKQAEPSRAELDSYLTLPLADGCYLRLDFSQHTTQERSLDELQGQIAAYVHAENQRFSSLSDHDEGVVLCSALIRAAHDRVVEAALHSQRLVLIGPTGSGKEVLARCLHQHSARKGKPFVAVNCAQLRDELLYAQLFGARRGAFTGAVADLPGLVEAAHGGTLFLDELADMDASTQRALLRFLDRRGEYLRLGDIRPRYADVQIVCATGRDLASEKFRAGGFREDLWYRLAVRVVHVPPLQQRPDDLIALLRARVARGSKCSILEAMTPAALQRVLAEAWPGNFRDIENFLQRLPEVTRAGTIDHVVVERALAEGQSPPASPPLSIERVTQEQPIRAPKVTPLDKQSWSEVLNDAVDFFLSDNAGPPHGWGQIHAFTERYLKPIFVARSTGLQGVVELPEPLNYSKLARQLGVSDGTTIKSHLHRYISLLQATSPWRVGRGKDLHTAMKTPLSVLRFE